MSPSIFKRSLTFTKAIKDFVSDGFQFVNAEQYESRLSICETCPLRSEKTCSDCGCYIPAKAKMRSQNCPQGKWNPIEDESGIT